MLTYFHLHFKVCKYIFSIEITLYCKMDIHSLKESTILKVLNLIAVAIEIAAIITTINTDMRIDPALIIMIHSVSLIWSVVYHIFPGVRTSFIFKFLTQTVCTLILMLTIINVAAFMLSESWASIILFKNKFNTKI